MTRPPVRGDDDFPGDRVADAHDDDRYDHFDPYDEHDGPEGDEYDDDDDGHEGAALDDEYEYDDQYEYDDDDDLGDADGDYEELRPESSRGRRALIVLAAVLAVFVVIIGSATFYVRGRLDPGGALGPQVRFNVPSGASANAVASLLEDDDIIEDAQIFRWYLRWRGADGFQAGDYILHENMAAWDVVDVLNGPPVPIDVATFTVPEGLTLRELPDAIVDDIPSFDADAVAELIAGGAIRPAALDPAIPNLEGFLFPDTYEIEAAQGEQAVIQRMAQQFDVVAAEIQLAERAAAMGRTPYEIVIIASLIQEEYGIVVEMPKIARVIYNRLEIGEPLGIDATSRYEAELAGRDRNDIDLDSDSPYNTRRNAGLPPTPIAAPGRAALEAALAPEAGPWIFYVRDPDESRTPPGGHFFTESAGEFARVKAECEAADLGCG